MARIRSVKPEFWTDPAVVSLPPLARLLFIGCWNHADDYGVLKDDPARLKLQILPSDEVDPTELVQQLVDANLILRRHAEDGTPVLVIRTFTDHQKIDKRSCGRWGHPDSFTESSPPIPTNPADSQPDATNPDPGIGFRTGTEGTGTDSQEPSSDSQALVGVASPLSPPATDPVVMVFEAWKEATDRTDRTQLDKKRRARIQSALKQYPLEDVLDAVRGWQNSPHHRGDNDAGTLYNEIELLLRDSSHIEKFRDLWRSPPRTRGRPTSVTAGLGNIQRALGVGQ